MGKKRLWPLLALFLFVLLGKTSFAAQNPKIYLSVFYTGKIGLVLDFSKKGSGLIAIMSEEGKWDIQIKDAKSQKVRYYKRGALKGKVKSVGNIYIRRFKRGHEEGQPSRIGNVVVKYYHQRSDAFYGKIKRIGNFTFKYHQYDTLPSYNKLWTIRNVKNNRKTLISYFINNKKGFQVSGKLRKIYSKQSRQKLTPVYTRNGIVKRVKGKTPFIAFQFFDKASLEQIQGGGDSDTEKKVERVLDRFLK